MTDRERSAEVEADEEVGAEVGVGRVVAVGVVELELAGDLGAHGGGDDEPGPGAVRQIDGQRDAPVGDRAAGEGGVVVGEAVLAPVEADGEGDVPVVAEPVAEAEAALAGAEFEVFGDLPVDDGDGEDEDAALEACGDRDADAEAEVVGHVVGRARETAAGDGAQFELGKSEFSAPHIENAAADCEPHAGRDQRHKARKEDSALSFHQYVPDRSEERVKRSIGNMPKRASYTHATSFSRMRHGFPRVCEVSNPGKLRIRRNGRETWSAFPEAPERGCRRLVSRCRGDSDELT